MAEGAIRVRGLKQLTSDFRRMSKDVGDDLAMDLSEAAEPVRKESTINIIGEMHNFPATPVYAAMRIGVDQSQGLVYIVPDWRSRGAGTPRPKLAGESGARSSLQTWMDKALDENTEEIVRRLEEALDIFNTAYGF